MGSGSYQKHAEVLRNVKDIKPHNFYWEYIKTYLCSVRNIEKPGTVRKSLEFALFYEFWPMTWLPRHCLDFTLVYLIIGWGSTVSAGFLGSIKSSYIWTQKLLTKHLLGIHIAAQNPIEKSQEKCHLKWHLVQLSRGMCLTWSSYHIHCSCVGFWLQSALWSSLTYTKLDPSFLSSAII